MAVIRAFLEWSKPALPAAASWLIDGAEDSTSRACDLRSTLCVLPGGRAGRLLLGHLIVQCRDRRLQLLPPPIVTPGRMIDVLLEIHQALAGDVESQWAWMEALEQAEGNTIKALLPIRPAEDDWRSWLELARVAAGLHEQLAGARLQFRDVAIKSQQLQMLSEADRWLSLDAVMQDYFGILKQHRLTDVHQARETRLAELNAQRREAGNGGASGGASGGGVVLIGVAELNQLQRAAIAAKHLPTTALIHAPPELADHFDECGCVISGKWELAEIGLHDEQIVIANRPADQAQEALRAIASLNGNYSAGQITIGLGSAELVPVMQHAGQWAGVGLRSAEGASLLNSPPCRALEAIGEWLRDNRFAPFAAMLRHPDIETWVWKRTRESDVGVSDWLSLLDKYFADHLHERLAENWLGDERMRERLQAVHRSVCELVAPLAQKPKMRNIGGVRGVGGWCQPMLDVLTNLYDSDASASGDPAQRLRVAACTALRDALAEFHAAPEPLQPRVTASQAVELALDAISGKAIPEELQHDQIEMLGWLELHLDDAPALIVAGVNEGDIPQSANADPFLPDSLRAALGLPCNATRYARDVYLMEAMRQSRADLRVIAGKVSAGGEPLTPSRLLLACDAQTLVQRVARFCVESEETHATTAPMGLHALAEVESKFVVPALPVNLPRRETMSITEFRTYLACPYRYALAKLLRLEAMDDSATELDAMQFGSLAHDALCEFGRDDTINASDDAEQIGNHLIRVVGSLAQRNFGKSHAPAVAVQLARLQQRMRSFANVQAQLNAKGWRIRHCELEFNGDVRLDIPGQDSMPLRGKIDRIDYNADLKQWRIIDYKTGDSAESPHKSHHNCEGVPEALPEDWHWQDLQLPLYHYLARHSALGIDGDISLAYICLPKQSDGARLNEAKWSHAHLEHALETARDVVRRIRAREFEINTDFDGRFDEFARICQTSAFSEREAAEVGAEVEE